MIVEVVEAPQLLYWPVTVDHWKQCCIYSSLVQMLPKWMVWVSRQWNMRFKSGCLHIVQFLVERFGYHHFALARKETLLHDAAACKMVDIVAWLLSTQLRDGNAGVNARMLGGKARLHCLYGILNQIEEESFVSALPMIFLEHNHYATLRTLVEQHADVALADNFGRTASHYALQIFTTKK